MTAVNPAIVVIQARMGSTRLPGKSLEHLGSCRVIDWSVRRASIASNVVGVIVATSDLPEDDVLADHVSSQGWRVSRGSSDDVLARFAEVVDKLDHEFVVRVTGDCPFVQPQFIDRAVEVVQDVDYVATDPDGRFPRGFDVEAIRTTALLAAHEESVDPVEREHVTPFIVRHPTRFESRALECPPWARRTDLRLTLDEADDLRALRAIVAGLSLEPEELSGTAVIKFLDEHPEVAEMNAAVRHNIVT